MSWLQKMDDAILDKVANPIAHKIEHATGVSNFTLAAFVLVIWPAAAGADALSKQRAIDWFLCAMVVLVSARRYAILVMLERRSRRKSALGNDDRMMSLLWRTWQSVVLLTFLPLNLLAWKISLADVGMWAVWVHLYFSACDRAPPKPVREPLFARPIPGHG